MGDFEILEPNRWTNLARQGECLIVNVITARGHTQSFASTIRRTIARRALSSDMQRKDVCALCAIISSPVFLALGNVILPAMFTNALIDALTLDTDSKLAAARDIGNKMIRNEPVEYVFLNVTNAYELQTVSPPPKPIFAAVPITFRFSAESFDAQLTDDAETFSEKTHFHLEFSDPADAQLSIVTAHSILAGLIRFCGGEQAIREMRDPNSSHPLAFACVPVYDMVEADTQQLRLDGTTPNNVGVFVRRTISELIYGHTSSLPAAALQLLGGSRITEFHMGEYNDYPTRASLEEAIATGSATGTMFETLTFTGKNNPSLIGIQHGLRGFTYASDSYNQGQWGVQGVPFDNDGISSPAGCILSPKPLALRLAGRLTGCMSIFNISGTRGALSPFSSQPMPPISAAPSFFESGYPAKAPPRQSSFDFTDFSKHYRRLPFSCGACTHELIINSLYVVKYSMDESAGALTVDGVPDEAGACAATGRCDFGMLWGPNVWAGYKTIMYPYALTLPYFGKASHSLSESATFETLGGTPLAYDEPTMRHELYIEPLTGKVLKYNMPFMFNIVGFDRTTFDGPLFANVFNSSTFPIVFPLHVESNRLTAGAAALNAIASAPAMAYLAMYLCTIVGIALFIWPVSRAMSKAIEWRLARRLNLDKEPKRKVKPDVAEKKNKSSNKSTEAGSVEMPQATMTIDLRAARPPSFTVRQSPVNPALAV